MKKIVFIMCWKENFLKIDKRDVPNKDVMVGKSSEEQINVRYVY